MADIITWIAVVLMFGCGVLAAAVTIAYLVSSAIEWLSNPNGSCGASGHQARPPSPRSRGALSIVWHGSADDTAALAVLIGLAAGAVGIVQAYRKD
jgi:hypothetical protein